MKLTEKMYEYPLFAFFLHTEDDTDVSEYLSQKSPDLDALTGDMCLIFFLEKPSKWEDGWKSNLKELYGPDFDKEFAQWEKETNYTRNEKIQIITDRLGLPMNHLPCMIFVEELNKNDFLEIPFIAEKESFKDYFRDVITCIQVATKAPQGDVLSTMKKEWRRYWLKWIATKKIKKYAKDFQECGSIIAETNDTIVSILKVISPIAKGVPTALTALALL